MRNELALLRNMWPSVFLGSALAAGHGGAEVASTQPSGIGLLGVRASALEEAVLDLGSPFDFAVTGSEGRHMGGGSPARSG